MLEVKQLSKKLLQVGPGFQKAGREGEGWEESTKEEGEEEDRREGRESRGGKGYKQESAQ